MGVVFMTPLVVGLLYLFPWPTWQDALGVGFLILVLASAVYGFNLLFMPEASPLQALREDLFDSKRPGNLFYRVPPTE
jgi:hypothetical protein